MRAFVWCGIGQVDPERHFAVRGEPGRIDPVRRGRRAVLVDVDLDQSPTFTCSAACAAARRATGTRYGEQLT